MADFNQEFQKSFAQEQAKKAAEIQATINAFKTVGGLEADIAKRSLIAAVTRPDVLASHPLGPLGGVAQEVIKDYFAPPTTPTIPTSQVKKTPGTADIPSSSQRRGMPSSQNTMASEDQRELTAWRATGEYNRNTPAPVSSPTDNALNYKDYFRPNGGVRLGRAVNNKVLDAYTQGIGWNKPGGGTISMGSIPEHLRYENQVPLSKQERDNLAYAQKYMEDIAIQVPIMMDRLKNTMETTKDARVYAASAQALGDLMQSGAQYPTGMAKIGMVAPAFIADRNQQVWERMNVNPKDLATIEAMKAQAQRDRLQGELAKTETEWRKDPKNPEKLLDYFKAYAQFERTYTTEDPRGNKLSVRDTDIAKGNALAKAMGWPEVDTSGIPDTPTVPQLPLTNRTRQPQKQIMENGDIRYY